MSNVKCVRGKYALSPQTYVVCTLSLVSVEADEVTAWVGVHHEGDTRLSPGTTIHWMLPPDQDSEAAEASDAISLCTSTVKQVTRKEGKPLHHCSSIIRAIQPERRQRPRLDCALPVGCETLQGLSWGAVEGSAQGLSLRVKTRQRLLGLAPSQVIPWTLTHRGTDYTIPGRVTHVHYDWFRCEHSVGLAFDNLDTQTETILNLLIDPNFTVDISQTKRIDASEGRIHAQS